MVSSISTMSLSLTMLVVDHSQLAVFIGNHRADERHANRCCELLPDERKCLWINCRPNTVHRHRHSDRNGEQRCQRRAKDSFRHVRDLPIRFLRHAITTHLGWAATRGSPPSSQEP